MDKKASLDIVTVNWNAGRQLAECLASTSAAARDGFSLNRARVVDNASTDGSADNLRVPGLPVEVIRNLENRGFAAACNQGAAGSLADYLLFLGPDMRLSADSLSKPISFLEEAENRRVGICGIQLLDEQGRVARSCACFPTPRACLARILGLDQAAPRRFLGYLMTDWDHAESRPVDHVIGAFFLVRRSVFEELGGFDERFFVYLEDLDFSLRAGRAGWGSYYLADAQAFHKGGGASGQVPARRIFYSLRSRLLYAFKHFGGGAAAGLLAATLFLEPWARFVRAVLHRSPPQAGETLGAYAMLWVALPSILRAGRKGRAS
ncbi:MAG: glycosyltransferase family 2 protein [Verrucomicrobiota bacterium]|nr:glycosyltransferase family 2 protein [Verrucomicrobiota bacterium]